MEETATENPEKIESEEESHGENEEETEDPSNSSHVKPSKSMEPVGEPLQKSTKVPKVKLEISSGPLPPVQDYEPLPYGRRKKGKRLENRVKLILSAKRIHPGTKSNNILLEPITENQEDSEDKPLKIRRKRKTEQVPLSMTPSMSILDAFEDAFEDSDNAFTTIKDLAERSGVEKLEPLDYDDFYYGAFDDDTEPVKDIEEVNIKQEPLEDFDIEEDIPIAAKKRKTVKKKKEIKVESDEDYEDDEEAKPKKKVARTKSTSNSNAEGDRKLYDCLYCEFSSKKSEWISHLKKDHADKNLVFCPVKKCQKPFECEAKMREHEEMSHIKNICTFEGCGKEFKFKSVLREHRKTHYPADCDWMADPDPDMTIDRFFVCTYCGKRYRTRTGWRAHEAYVHTKQLDFKCEEEGCDKAFFSENELMVHKRKHSGELPFTCSYCGNRYISAHSLAQHEKASHLQTEDVECEVCNKKVRKRNLPAHVKTHSEFKGLPCQFCNKEFPTIGSLKRHEKIHMEVKEHKCRFCGKGFVQKANMQSHERIHTGERPYKCQFCNEGFVQSTRRRQHEAACKMRHQ